MVSFLPSDVKRKNSVVWWTTKFLVIFTIATAFWVVFPFFQNSERDGVVVSNMIKWEGVLMNGSDHGVHHCNVMNITASEQCEFVKNEEACGKYLIIHYCYMNKFVGGTVLFYIGMVLFVFVLFYLLGNTAENYFVPPLTKISEYLKLSPNVAGVTFLALGNGAPDLSSIIVGVFQGSTGFGVGEPIGAGVFVTTVVLGLVSILAEVKVTRRPFLRDSITYLIAVCFAFYMFLNQRVAVYESIICIVIYVLYVCTVVFGRMINQWWKRRRARTQVVVEEEGSGADSDHEWTGEWGYTVKFVNQMKKNEDHERRVSVQKSNEDTHLLAPKESFSLNKVVPKETIIVKENHFPTNMDESGNEGDDENDGPKGCVPTLWGKFMDSIEWHEKKWWQKSLFIFVEWYWDLFRNLTVFKGDPADWNKWFACCVPIFSPMFIVLVIGGPQTWIWLIDGKFPFVLIFVMSGLVVSFIILVTSPQKRAPIYQPVLVIAAFFLSIFWLYSIARELLIVLSSFGILLNIPESVLAVTVLAWGNSIGDLVSDVVVAREGYPSMAVGAIFGSPSLNLLIGLGIAMTFNATSLRTGCFPLTADSNVSLSFIFLIISLVMSIIVIPLGKFRSYRLYGFVLIGIYLVYLTLSIVMVFVKPLDDFFTWNIGTGCRK